MPSTSPGADRHGLLLIGAVVVQLLVLAAPGPTLLPAGYVFFAALLVLAALSPARRWAASTVTVLESLLAVSGRPLGVGEGGQVGRVRGGAGAPRTASAACRCPRR